MTSTIHPRTSPLIRALIATGVLYFALRLSAGDRGPVDWIVLGVIGATLVWNLVQLSRLMLADGGPKALWHVQRTALFWIIGLMNTVWIRPEEAGTWKNWLGLAILAIAVGDTVALLRQEHRLLRAHRAEEPTT